MLQASLGFKYVRWEFGFFEVCTSETSVFTRKTAQRQRAEPEGTDVNKIWCYHCGNFSSCGLLASYADTDVSEERAVYVFEVEESEKKATEYF
jgi:hypothetical protein